MSFWSLPEPLLLLCLPVEVARVKPSDLPADPVVLETHQLYSRLISCTRDSSVVLERLALSIWGLSVCVCLRARVGGGGYDLQPMTLDMSLSALTGEGGAWIYLDARSSHLIQTLYIYIHTIFAIRFKLPFSV